MPRSSETGYNCYGAIMAPEHLSAHSWRGAEAGEDRDRELRAFRAVHRRQDAHRVVVVGHVLTISRLKAHSPKRRTDAGDRRSDPGVVESAKSESLRRLADTVSSVEGESIPDEKLMRLRYSGTCRLCGVELPAKAEAICERASKTVRCITHESSSDVSPAVFKAVDVGSPGASARREFERRKAKREERTRTKHPKLGGLILALSADPQSTKAWDTGALGEERLGNRLNELASDSLRVLHDRRIPGSRANIDHIVVARRVSM